MGTRFLMTAESPVPRATLEKYLAVKEPSQIRASTAVDGMPQRMIDNPFLLKLESGGLIHRLFVALSSAWRWRAHTGMSIAHMAKTFRSEEHTSELQSLMRISYAVFCLKKTKQDTNKTNTQQ